MHIHPTKCLDSQPDCWSHPSSSTSTVCSKQVTVSLCAVTFPSARCEEGMLWTLTKHLQMMPSWREPSVNISYYSYSYFHLNELIHIKHLEPMEGAHDTLTPSSCSGGTLWVSLYVYFINTESSSFPWAKLHISVGFQRASASGTWEKPKSGWQWRGDGYISSIPKKWRTELRWRAILITHCACCQLSVLTQDTSEKGVWRVGLDTSEGGTHCPQTCLFTE